MPDPISPDCKAGKHPVHPDEAWDDEKDEITECRCECHKEEP